MEVPEDQTKKVAHLRQWVCDRAREIREASGYTQAQVADKMGVHLSRINDFEKNRNDYKASTIFRFAMACGISIERFFRGVPTSKSDGKKLIVIDPDDLTKKMKDYGFDTKDTNGFIKQLRMDEV